MCSSLHPQSCLSREVTVSICGCMLSLLVSNQSMGGGDCFRCGFFAHSFYILEIACVSFLGVVVVFIGICYLL